LTDTLRSDQAALVLILETGIDSTVATVCQRSIQDFGSVLSPWGRFRHPVRVHTTMDRNEVSASSGHTGDGLLCAVARHDSLVLLAPDRWRIPPTSSQLERTIVHELTHVLVFQRCAPTDRAREVVLPTWFREGMATVVAEGSPAPSERRSLQGHGKLEDLALADANLLGRQPKACYTLAALTFAAWMEQFGQRHLSSVFREMRLGHGFNAAHRKACGIAHRAWLGQWLDSLVAQWQPL